MRRVTAGLRSLVAIGGLLLTLVASEPAPAQPAAAQAAAQTGEPREILVMLRLAPDHFRPNASYGGDYGDGLSDKARHRLAAQIAHRHRLDLLDSGWPMPLLGLDCFVMRVPAGMTVGAAVEEVGRDPRVAWSQPMQLYRAQAAAGSGRDPMLALQPAQIAWHLDDLHRFATGRGVTIAVVDSKIEVGHPDLIGQFVTDQDFVGSGNRAVAAERHGTEVAGVIAAKADNGIGIAGIAPGARLMALRACWQTGPGVSAPTLCNSLGLAQAIQFAIQHGAKVINLSLAGPPDRLLGRLIEVAEARNISIVAAYDPALPGGGFPASQPGVIAVANESLSRLPPGVYGAPGNDVPTTQPGGKWYLVDGSSFAAAHVSGLIALVRQAQPRPLARIILAVAGHNGVVDPCATLLRAKPCDCPCPVVEAVASSAR